MAINGIQNGVQASAEFYSLQFSSSSQTNGCGNNGGIQFNDQQLQNILDRLNQAFNPNGSGECNSPAQANSPDCENGSNGIKDLLEKIFNLLKSLTGDKQPQTEAPKEKEGGNFLEKLLTAPLDMAKSLIGGIFGGGGESGGGGLFGGLLGGIFGGK